MNICYNCANRHVTCHCTCKKYQEAKKVHDQKREERHKLKEVERVADEFTFESRKRAKINRRR